MTDKFDRQPGEPREKEQRDRAADRAAEPAGCGDADLTETDEDDSDGNVGETAGSCDDVGSTPFPRGGRLPAQEPTDQEPSPAEDEEAETAETEAEEAEPVEEEAEPDQEEEAGDEAEFEESEEEKLSEEGAPESAEETAPGKRRRVQPTEVSAEFKRQVEALLFATEQPITAKRIAAVLKVREPLVRVAIHDLAAEYRLQEHAFAVEEIANGYQVLTRPDYGRFVKQLYEDNRKSRLSQAALETLAIVAYKQPVMRVEIEDIRGVGISEVLRTLLDMGLVRVVGRAEVLGRPMLYGTTHKFLLTFGLKSPKDLPSVEELKKQQS